MRTVLVISFSPISRDSRVLRHIGSLAQCYKVIACGFGPLQLSDIEGISVVPIGGLAKLGFATLKIARMLNMADWFDPLSNAAWSALKIKTYDLVLANDLNALPVAVQLSSAHSVPLIWDAHEWALEEFTDRFLWRLIQQPLVQYRLKRYLQHVTRAITVSPGIAMLYKQFYDLPMEIVRNVPPYHELSPKLAVEGEPLRLVHHGGANSSRKLETIIESFKKVKNNYLLDFYLVANSRNDNRYVDRLKRFAFDDARIRFLNPVTPDQIIKTIHSYDVGVFFLAPSNPNNIHALPNKIFEFIQARIGVLISPNPDMAELVRTWGVGFVVEDFSVEAFSKALSTLNYVQVNRWKIESHRAANELTAERECGKLIDIVEELVGT